jgi:hypothetical protein
MLFPWRCSGQRNNRRINKKKADWFTPIGLFLFKFKGLCSSKARAMAANILCEAHVNPVGALVTLSNNKKQGSTHHFFQFCFNPILGDPLPDG